MRLLLVSVFDRAVQAYGRPFCVTAAGQAVRAFTDEVQNPQGEMFKHPKDYELYELGFFDDSDGSFELYKKPKLLLMGENCVGSGSTPKLAKN